MKVYVVPDPNESKVERFKREAKELVIAVAPITIGGFGVTKTIVLFQQKIEKLKKSCLKPIGFRQGVWS